MSEGFTMQRWPTKVPTTNSKMMLADGNPVRQKRTRQRARLFAGMVESSDEHRQSLTETLATLEEDPKKVATARNAEPRPFSQTMDQEAERGRFDSQQFLELVKYGSKNLDSVKKASKYLEDFETTIYVQVEDLAIQLDRQKAQLSSREMEFSDYFAAAYSPILRDNATAQMLDEQLNTYTSRSCNVLHQNSTEILIGAAALIEQVRKSCRELENQQTSYTGDTDWQKDMHKIKRILDSGRQIGEQKVEGIFTGAGSSMLDAQTVEISQLLYDRHNRPAGGPTWDQAVRKQEKAVMRLVSTLPWE